MSGCTFFIVRNTLGLANLVSCLYFKFGEYWFKRQEWHCGQNRKFHRKQEVSLMWQAHTHVSANLVLTVYSLTRVPNLVKVC